MTSSRSSAASARTDPRVGETQQQQLGRWTNRHMRQMNECLLPDCCPDATLIGANKHESPACAGLSEAGATGLEPATSGVTGRRSNQLNYAPAAEGSVPARRKEAG